MKRRVANLAPVSASVFNQKILDRRKETAIAASPKDTICEVCRCVSHQIYYRSCPLIIVINSGSKSYTTENAYRSHILSKKHKENEAKAALKAAEPHQDAEREDEQNSNPEETTEVEIKAGPSAPSTLTVDEDATEDDVAMTIDQKIAAARSRLSPQHCLFCPVESSSVDTNLTHMARTHSFFLPEDKYITDKQGLLTYLGEKIAVGNVCIYCNTRSREFRTLEAVRKHMLDKSHCKLAYGTDADKLELSDYYDFSTSYPAVSRRAEKAKKKLAKKAVDEEWEDMDEDGEDADEIIEESASESDSDSDSGTEFEVHEIEFDRRPIIDDSTFELVLPSGTRLGHRSLKRYYEQSFNTNLPPREGEDPKSGAAIVRKLVADKDSALVPRKGGYGAYKAGTDVVKAKNRGEAKEAGRHVREFRDQKKKENFKTKIGFVNNSQKHYRDALLQVSLFTFILLFKLGNV
jgi:pre-60S factor REI1